MNLDYVKKQRGLPFVKIGMKVQSTYNGKFGYITGGNMSGNLQIRFEGKNHSENYHPHWEIKYFDDKGNVIKEYIC